MTDLENSFQQEKLDHERETRFNRDIQLHEMELMQQIHQIKSIMVSAAVSQHLNVRWYVVSLIQDREPFVVILLDGEGIIFKDEFLQQGEEGGRNAAKQLSTALNTYLTTNLSNINIPKLLTKIYMNVRVFGEMCTRSGIIADPSGIHDFIRGFNETMSFSEIVDIGSSKNTVLDKMKGKFPLKIRK